MSSLVDPRVELLKSKIKSYPNFPKEGILFRDFFSLLSDPPALKLMKDVLSDRVCSMDVDVIVGLESRGFIVGCLVAAELGIPFVPIRKKGKLPGTVKGVKYQLEYGEDEIEIQTDSLAKGKKVLIMDDLLATGGTAEAAVKLLKICEVDVVGALVLMELTGLNGRKKLSGINVHSIIEY